MADGNIHVVVILPPSVYRTSKECETGSALVNGVVHEEAARLNGSISAEHGIGLTHVGRLKKYKAPLDIELMQALRATFARRA